MHFQWRCGECKTPNSKYVDALWRKTFVSAGGKPSCELGCVGGAVHFGRECGRPIGPFEVALKAAEKESEPTIRVRLASGPDFVCVASAHRTRAVFLELPVQETCVLGPTAVKFSVGVCVLPTCIPGSTLAATYRTAAFIAGAPIPCGKLPHIFSIVKSRARVVDSVAFSSGAPLGSFLGMPKEIWKSPCAMNRYVRIIYGHTAKQSQSVLPAAGAAVYQPKLSVGPELAPSPRPIMWTEAYRCVYCGTLHKTRADFIRACAPELPA